MSEGIIEAIIAFFEHAAGELWSRGRPRLPRRGTQLRARKRAKLSGRDLRPEPEAAGFVAYLPSQTIVRVDDMTGEDAAGLWVRPMGDILTLVPAECRASAAAYGYAFEIPPGIMTEYFEVVSPAI